MPVVRTYGCPDCGGSFDFMHMTRDEPPPAHCELCKAFMGEVEPELPGVNIGGSNISKSVDQVYRDAERTMGVTDWNDGLRAGDETAKRHVPDNAVSRFMRDTGSDYWAQTNVTDLVKAAGARRNPEGTGAGVIGAMQEKNYGRKVV